MESFLQSQQNWFQICRLEYIHKKNFKNNLRELARYIFSRSPLHRENKRNIDKTELLKHNWTAFILANNDNPEVKNYEKVRILQVRHPLGKE